jgi:hypothetical protein
MRRWTAAAVAAAAVAGAVFELVSGKKQNILIRTKSFLC